jgi:phage terminase large subunit
MIEQTTALRKIAALRKRIKGIQGGQGASKTYSILMLIINHASSVPDKEIYIASDELSKMRITVIKDFVNIMKLVGLFKKDHFTDGTLYKFPNGSFIKFLGLDKDDIGKGLRSDLVFVNEANKVKFSTYRELTSRAKQVFLDFNPNKKFWFHTEVMPRNDCDFLKLTFLDNEFLSKEEVSEILRYKQLGFDSNGVVYNQYWANMWRVYGLGEVGQVEGRIYNWKPISYFDYLNIEKETYYGCDWGLVDPFAVVEVKYYDGNLYVHELNYASENELRRGLNETQLHQINAHQEEGLVSWLFERLNIRKEALIVCDSNRPTKIHALRRSGWEYAVAVGGKSRVVDRIGTLQSLNIYYTDSSRNIEFEQEAYCRKKDKFDVVQEEPEDDNNHTLDAITYITEKLFKMGVIKNL